MTTRGIAVKTMSLNFGSTERLRQSAFGGRLSPQLLSLAPGTYIRSIRLSVVPGDILLLGRTLVRHTFWATAVGPAKLFAAFTSKPSLSSAIQRNGRWTFRATVYKSRHL